MDKLNREEIMKDLEALLKKHGLPEGCLFFEHPIIKELPIVKALGIAHIAQGPTRSWVIRAIRGAVETIIAEALEKEAEAERMAKNN